MFRTVEGRYEIFGLRLQPHVFYLILLFGVLGLLVLFGYGCSCACRAIRRPIKQAERRKEARGKLERVKEVMGSLERAAEQGATNVGALIQEAERELGKAQIRHPEIADTEEYKEIVKRLNQIKARGPDSTQEAEKQDAKKGAPR